MRRTTEFKGYRSIVVYDTESGAFAAEPLPEDRVEIMPDDPLQAWGEVLPFPAPKTEKAKLKPRKAG